MFRWVPEWRIMASSAAGVKVVAARPKAAGGGVAFDGDEDGRGAASVVEDLAVVQARAGPRSGESLSVDCGGELAEGSPPPGPKFVLADGFLHGDRVSRRQGAMLHVGGCLVIGEQVAKVGNHGGGLRELGLDPSEMV